MRGQFVLYSFLNQMNVAEVYFIDDKKMLFWK